MTSPTLEQLAALELFETEESLAIEAGAGTGKTTTLQLLAKSTARRGQYVAFNKSIVQEAETKMPPTVRANTAHSLAFRAVGYKYKHRLFDSQRMRSWEIAKILDLDPFAVTTFQGERKVLRPTFLAGLTMAAITQFCNTADPEPTYRHVPWVEGLDSTEDGKRSYAVNNAVGRNLESAMKRAWADLQKIDGRLRYSHEHYLKAWQLQDPRIEAEFILFDEAQDANPVMMDIVSRQEHAQLVWVGDSQQQIYSFTGARNALDNVPAENRSYLTQSFRFGPEIADVANVLLARLGSPLKLRGTPSVVSEVATLDSPDVILSRTNASAVRTVLERGHRQRIHLIGGGGEVLRFARAADALMQGRGTEHPELACFDSWAEVQEYVRHDEQGGELRLMVNLVDTFGAAAILTALGKNVREEDADLIVSTAHKAKGREWDAVQLAADFPPQPQGEELRLLYVASTRAKRELDIDAVEFLNEILGVRL